MDILDDILSTLNLKGALYFRTHFSGDWAITVPDLAGASRFHLVVQGTCHVTFRSGASVTLHPGDLVLIPRGREHILADAPGRPSAPLETVLEESGYDGAGVFVLGDENETAATQLVCGHFSFRDGAEHALLSTLPDHVVTTASDRAKEPLLDETLRLIVRRIFTQAPGSTAAVKRLSESFFVELLRRGAERSSDMAAVLSAMQDPHIGNALAKIHAAPESPWTVETLAAEVGMSRSRFADRFRDLLGQSPMAYLSEWRLQKALSLLDGSRASVQQIAVQSGYQSPAAFTRAFTAKFGTSPTNYRRQST